MFSATPFLRAYARHRFKTVEKLDPIESQKTQLLRLISKCAGTQFGREHDFTSIKSVEDYQKKVPLRTYEKFWNEYWKPKFPFIAGVSWPDLPSYFAVSSGTTSGTTKYIPCTNEILASNQKAGLDTLIYHLINRPKSDIFGGKNLILGGSTNLDLLAPGVWAGDLSGIVAKTTPWWIKGHYFPPPELAFISDWEEKIDKIARKALEIDIRMISGVPSWLLIFLDKCRELRGDSGALLRDFFPNLELVVHGGIKFDSYMPVYQELLAGSHAETREVYPASEGFLGVQDRGYNEGMRLVIDNGIFFEFVPLEELDSDSPTRHWVANVQKDVNYAVILTTCAGLFSYVIGDTVRFIETSPPRILVTGRTSYMLSAFGEHLIEEEIQDGLNRAAATACVPIGEYSVGPVFPKSSAELGKHLYIVECLGDIPSEEQQNLFLSALDGELKMRNDDYRAHRSDGYGLNPPELLAVRHGTFQQWMKHRGKLGGQNKVPRVINDSQLFDDLVTFAKRSID